jgi:hypothetical protein
MKAMNMMSARYLNKVTQCMRAIKNTRIMQAQKQDKITKQNDMQKWERIIKHCKHKNRRE